MESLAEETWDLVIAGTGLVQALLALTLSRSGLKILHVDENQYYGGAEAGLSLNEIEAWNGQSEASLQKDLPTAIPQPSATSTKLANSRSYTLSLLPQIVYAQSTFLPSLVSSTINNQLEFLAVGPWWICKQGKLQKVPSSREDVFADDGLSRRDKIGLMKFLRYVLQDHENEDDAQVQESSLGDENLQASLSSRFKISPDLQLPVAALALTPYSARETLTEAAVARIRRHMKSMGYFGPGFGAVLAKYAGNAEIAQVACRACAVGGAIYLLGQGVTNIMSDDKEDTVSVTLTCGVTVKTKRLVGTINSLPQSFTSRLDNEIWSSERTCYSISIISSPLSHLFPPTSDNGPVPAAAIVLVTDTDSTDDALSQPPIYLQIHSADTGECPTGQCIIYASTLNLDPEKPLETHRRVRSAVLQFLEASSTEGLSPDEGQAIPEILWSMPYLTRNPPLSHTSAEHFVQDDSGKVLIFAPRPHDISLDDDILAQVKAVWENILGEASQNTDFLRFEDRSDNQGGGDE